MLIDIQHLYSTPVLILSTIIVSRLLLNFIFIGGVEMSSS